MTSMNLKKFLAVTIAATFIAAGSIKADDKPSIKVTLLDAQQAESVDLAAVKTAANLISALKGFDAKKHEVFLVDGTKETQLNLTDGNKELNLAKDAQIKVVRNKAEATAKALVDATAAVTVVKAAFTDKLKKAAQKYSDLKPAEGATEVTADARKTALTELFTEVFAAKKALVTAREKVKAAVDAKAEKATEQATALEAAVTSDFKPALDTLEKAVKAHPAIAKEIGAAAITAAVKLLKKADGAVIADADLDTADKVKAVVISLPSDVKVGLHFLASTFADAAKENAIITKLFPAIAEDPAFKAANGSKGGWSTGAQIAIYGAVGVGAAAVAVTTLYYTVPAVKAKIDAFLVKMNLKKEAVEEVVVTA